jgi:hypothetical protein
MTAVGMIEETIGAEKTGVESKTAGKPNAVVIGSAIMIGTSTATRTITATIVASAQPRNKSADSTG